MLFLNDWIVKEINKELELRINFDEDTDKLEAKYWDKYAKEGAKNDRTNRNSQMGNSNKAGRRRKHTI